MKIRLFIQTIALFALFALTACGSRTSDQITYVKAKSANPSKTEIVRIFNKNCVQMFVDFCKTIIVKPGTNVPFVFPLTEEEAATILAYEVYIAPADKEQYKQTQYYYCVRNAPLVSKKCFDDIDEINQVLTLTLN